MPLTPSPDRGSDARAAGQLRGPRRTAAIVWRGLLGGAGAGGVLGALVVLPDLVQAHLVPEPDVAPAVTWSALLVAVPVGAVVGVMAALLALAVWEWQIPRGARRARVAGSATAAAAVVAIAVLYALVTAAPGTDAWTSQGLVVVAIAAVISFAIAYLLVPVITTRRPILVLEPPGDLRTRDAAEETPHP